MDGNGPLLPSLPYIQLNVDFIALDEIKLPRFMGSTLRGAFGYAFRKSVCISRNRNCSTCPIYDRCVYAYVFDTPTVGKNGLLQKTPFAPHPFVLTPPLIGRNSFSPGDVLSFGLTLFGKGIDYLPHFLTALDVMGRSGLGKSRGRMALSRTMQNGVVISKGTRLIGKPNPQNIIKFEKIAKQDIGAVRINFLTPTKLMWHGKLLHEPVFSAIIESTLRRIKWLVEFHTDEKWTYPEEPLKITSSVKTVSQNIQNFDMFRYSTRKKRRIQFKGFVGEAVFEGEIAPLLPLLMAMEVVHIGKATSFGFGRVAVEPLP